MIRGPSFFVADRILARLLRRCVLDVLEGQVLIFLVVTDYSFWLFVLVNKCYLRAPDHSQYPEFCIRAWIVDLRNWRRECALGRIIVPISSHEKYREEFKSMLTILIIFAHVDTYFIFRSYL
jgi:hypothetical protein